MKSLVRAIDALEAWVTKNPSRINQLVNGTAEVHKRAAPAQTVTNDADIGLRLDHAGIVEKNGKKYKRLSLQPNKNAKNSTIKELAQKDSHQILAQADILVEQNPKTEQSRLRDLFSDLRAKVKK